MLRSSWAVHHQCSRAEGLTVSCVLLHRILGWIWSFFHSFTVTIVLILGTRHIPALPFPSCHLILWPLTFGDSGQNKVMSSVPTETQVAISALLLTSYLTLDMPLTSLSLSSLLWERLTVFTSLIVRLNWPNLGNVPMVPGPVSLSLPCRAPSKCSCSWWWHFTKSLLHVAFTPTTHHVTCCRGKKYSSIHAEERL